MKQSLQRYFLVILGLSAFAVAQPVLNILGQGATFFVEHRAEFADVVCFALVVYLFPPLVLTAIAGCIGWVNATAGKISVCIVLAVLSALCLMPFLLSWTALVSIPLALGFGAAFGLCYFYLSKFGELLQWLGALSPVVVVSFLFFTPANSLLGSEEIIIDSGSEAQNDTPIVILLFDELSLAAITTPDGSIDAGRLPNFDRLSQHSTWYFDTTTVSTFTGKSVPAILTGQRPKEKHSALYSKVVAFLTGETPESRVLPIYNEHPENLFSLFAATHAIEAMESVTKLCPDSVCFDTAPSENNAAVRGEFDVVAMYRDVLVVWKHAVFPLELAERYLPSIAMTWGKFDQGVEAGNDSSGFDAAERLREFDSDRELEKFVSLIRSGVGPRVTYLHLAIPHNPWDQLPDGMTYNGELTRGMGYFDWHNTKYLVDQGVIRYSFQVEYADLLLGKVLDALEQSGQMDDTMFIVLSDHGIAFEPGASRRTPTESTLADVARVPLFIKYPHQVSGVKDMRRVETIDVFPTIADVAQLPLNKSVDGQSLISEDWKPVTRSVFEAEDSLPDFESAMNLKAASERIYEVIAPGVTALNALGFGQTRKYMGKPIPDILEFDTQLQLKIISRYCYQHVDMDIGFLPIYMRGVLKGAHLDQEVMIALNGIIAGGGVTYHELNPVSILLDPSTFIWWENELRAFIFKDEGIAEIAVTCGK
jgi:hypothetical protein